MAYESPGILVRDSGFHADDRRGELVQRSGEDDHFALPAGAALAVENTAPAMWECNSVGQ